MNARDNPFAMDRIESLIDFEPEWHSTTWPDLLDRWRELDYRAAVTGAHGSGKTTLLRSLPATLKKQHPSINLQRIFLNDRQTDLSPRQWQQLEAITDVTTILLDGAEQMPRQSWHRFDHVIRDKQLSLPIHALITQHRPTRSRWPTLLATTPSSALLSHLIKKISIDFHATLTEAQIKTLFTVHKGNLREALWDCYDQCSAQN